MEHRNYNISLQADDLQDQWVKPVPHISDKTNSAGLHLDQDKENGQYKNEIALPSPFRFLLRHPDDRQNIWIKNINVLVHPVSSFQCNTIENNFLIYIVNLSSNKMTQPA